MKRAAKAEGIPTNVPWYDLTEAQQRFIYDGRGSGPNSWPGIRGFFDQLERKKYKLHVRVFLSEVSRLRHLPRLSRPTPAS